MPRVQVQKIGDTVALLLTAELLELIGVRLGDEVEMTVENKKLIVSLPDEEAERQEKIEKAMQDVFQRRSSVYQKLAKGVQKQGR